MSVLSRYQSAGRMVRLAHRTLVALGVIVIMAGPASAADPVRGGTLNVGMPETFKGFSPYIQIGRQGFNVAINVFDTLTRYGADYLPEPMLATDWEQPDDTTWRFSLRKGVTFHDGTPFNAEAAKYSLEKIKESRFGKNIKRVTEVLVVDEYTIDIKLSEPFPVLPAVLTQQYASIVSPTAFEKMGADEFAKHPVGSGAFKFETQDSTGSVTLLRNDDYWDKDEKGNAYPYLDKVVYRIVPDRQTAALSMQAGDIDFNYEIPLSFTDMFKADPDIEVSETPTLGWFFVFLHAGKPPFDDVHKRRAFQLAIDRRSIVDAVLLGDGAPALGPIAPMSWAYDSSIETSGFYGLTADPGKAKAELAAGGASAGFEFTMVYPAEDPFTGMAQALHAQLDAIGVKVNLVGKDFGGALDDMVAGSFEALMMDYSGRIDEALVFGPFFQTGGASNMGHYSNSEVDSLVTKAGSSSDVEERKRLYREAQKLIVEDSPLVWINYPTDRKSMRRNVHGYENFGDFRMRFYDVWKKD
jgi:peptide/nickel transport system substrate-binding protein